MNGTTAYPLQWPTGRPRTPCYLAKPSNFFATSFAVARDNLLAELKRDANPWVWVLEFKRVEGGAA